MPDDADTPDWAVHVQFGRGELDACPRGRGRIIELESADRYLEDVRMEILQQNVSVLAACFMGTAHERSCRSASVAVSLTVSSAGFVEHICARGSDPSMATCVEDALRPTRLPEPETNSYEMNFPIRFVAR